jgi:hypothetical protein
MARHQPRPAPEAIEVTAHPPERGRGGRPVVLPSGCCCCCCCCLHSLGSLVGGIVGSVQQIQAPPRPVDPDFPFPYRRDEFEVGGPVLPVGILYWLLVCFGLGATGVYYFLFEGRQRPDSLFMGVLVGLFFLPAVQLGASVVAGLAVLCFYSDKATAGIRLGKITLWSVVGTIIGVVAMGGCCGLFTIVGKF